MTNDDFVRGAGQVLAKTGAGDFKMVSMPSDIAVDSTINILEEGRNLGGQGKEYKELIEGGGDLVNVKGMDWDEKNKLRHKAGELTGSDETGFMHQEKGEKFKKILNRYKKLFGKASKALPMLQILDIFDMKDQYDQLMEGEHPVLNQLISSEVPTAADGGIMRLKKGGWTPGKGGSKASKDYYKAAKREYAGRKPAKKEKKKWSGDYDGAGGGGGSQDTGGLSKQNQKIKDETARRIAAGDTSAYVKKSAKKFGLTVPTRTTYDPSKVSRTIQRVDTTGMDAKDAYRANQAFFAQQANNEKIIAQKARRRAVEEAFHKRGNVNRSDFTGKVEGSGIFGTNIGAKYSGKPKLREGLTGNEYHDWMRKLYGANPPMMEQLFPLASGKTLRNIASMTGPGRLLKSIGSVGRDVAGAMGQGLGKIFPGMADAASFEYNKFMKNFDNIGPNITRDVKSILNLSPTEEANLNIINKELNSDQKDLQGVLKAQNDDWTGPILGDAINEAETQSIDDFENTKDEIYDENVDPNYWSHGYTLPLQKTPGFDEEYEEIRNESADKLDYIKKTTGIDASGPNMIDNLDQLYEMARSKEDEGQVWDKPSGKWQAKPTAGQFDLSAQEDIFNVGGDQVDEIREQIDWNTANRPLDWSGGETPELTEDFIKENIKTGSDLWDFNQGGYLKKFDDGGYANMSTYEKLKAINDSIAEG